MLMRRDDRKPAVGGNVHGTKGMEFGIRAVPVNPFITRTVIESPGNVVEVRRSIWRR